MESLLFHSSYCLPRLMLWWRNRRTPSTGGDYHTGASSQRSRLVPRPVVLDVLALPWRSRPSRVYSCSLLGRYIVTPGYSTPNPSCPSHEVLALVRPVVSYTLVLSSKRSRPVVSPTVRSTAALFCRPVASQASYHRVVFRPSKALLSFSNLKYSKKS